MTRKSFVHSSRSPFCIWSPLIYILWRNFRRCAELPPLKLGRCSSPRILMSSQRSIWTRWDDDEGSSAKVDVFTGSIRAALYSVSANSSRRRRKSRPTWWLRLHLYILKSPVRGRTPTWPDACQKELIRLSKLLIEIYNSLNPIGGWRWGKPAHSLVGFYIIFGGRNRSL